MIHVLVADDMLVVREGLKTILNRTGDIRVAGTSRTCKETLEKLKRESFDILILDLIMPDRSGLGLLIDIKQAGITLPILVYTGKEEFQFGIACFQAGAKGYLTKEDGDLTKLPDAIRNLHTGGTWWSSELTHRIRLMIENPDLLSPHEKLSAREFEVFYMIASGKEVKEIANALDIKNGTVRTYRARIAEKTGLDSDYKIIQYCFRRGIVE